VLRLLVLRHAKAAPHDEKHDRERPLVARGREDAARIGRVMREKSYIPQLVLCSPAARTVQTWEQVAAWLDNGPVLDVRDALYDASEATIMACVRDMRTSASCLLYVGHNPGLERFAGRMLARPQGDAERLRYKQLALKFPTAALAVIDFGVGHWAQIEPATGALSDVITPADFEHG
jgi:phosphohistidine phosphatase